MAIVVHCAEKFLEQRGTRRDVEAPLEGHQPINEGPRGRALIIGELLPERDQCKVMVMCLTMMVDEVEARPGDGKDRSFLGVAVGQSICHHVCVAHHVFDEEIEAQQFSHPVVLWNGWQALV